MKIKTCAFLAFACSFFMQNTIAQSNPIQFYKVDSINGKDIGKITGITQDPSGTMWFCGQAKGSLYRFDGSKLSALTHDNNNENSLGFKNLETVYADDRGLVWIGGGGLDQYNPATGNFKHYRHHNDEESSLVDGYVSTIYRDRKGNIWVGTFSGLDKLDERTGKFTHYRYDSSNSKTLSNNFVEVIYEDRNGVLWVGTGIPWVGTDGGLNKMNPDGSFTRYMHDPKDQNSLLSNKVRTILEDSRGNFWVGTSGEGLHLMNREKGIFERHLFDPKNPGRLSGPVVKPGHPFDGITFLCEDKTGAIWIGSYLEGLSRYDPVTKETSRYRMGNGFPDSTTFKGFIGRDGTLWVATERSELLFKADPGIKKVGDIQTGGLVARIMSDKKWIWVETWGKGLSQYDENYRLIHQYRHQANDPSSLSNDTIVSILKIPDEDTIWVGTSHGIDVLNPVTGKFSRFPITLTTGALNHGIFQIVPDNKNNLWIGTLGSGLIRYSRRTGATKQWLPDPKDTTSVGSVNISTTYVDKVQRVWIGTYAGREGAWKLDPVTGKFKLYLPGILVRHFFEDREGDLWVTTHYGLFRYDRKGDRFLPFFESQSAISSEVMVGIDEDTNGNLWLNTASALVRINRNRNDFAVFGRRYGINSQVHEDVFLGPLCISATGRILAGHQNGFYAVSPEELGSEKQRLDLVIAEFFLSGRSIGTGKDSGFLRSAETTNYVVLTHDQNNFGIRFTSTDYRSSGATRYYTMLENYDPVWRQSGSDKIAYYFNLAPGDYNFRLKAFSGDEIKGERGIRIHIEPPWWQTWWAYALYGIIFLAAVFGFVRFQKQRILSQERQRTQMKELAQAKEIEKAYTELKTTQAQLIQSEKMASLGELTAGIAHEIQNPLNFVNNFSEVNVELTGELKDELSKLNLEPGKINLLQELADNIRENEERINHHGRRADAIVKGMLQHSRISTGLKEPTDINQLADEYLRLAYHGLRAKDKSFNSAMKSDFDPSVGLVNIVPQDIGRVLLNLYNNAFYAASLRDKRKEAGFEPVVEVATKRTGGKVEISIKDNGDGITKKVLDKIFQPFFTTKPTGEGTGLGLSISFDIVKAHGGEIKVDTKEGEFTCFRVLLPA